MNFCLKPIQKLLYNFYIVQSEGIEEDIPKLITVKRTKKKSPIF